jgi:CRP-like cAMP-binding protein
MNFFRNIAMFSSLSLEDQEKLSAFCQFRELNSSDFLFKQWDEAIAMYLILEGRFSVEKDLQQINILGPGDIVWEMAFLDDSKVRSASIKCIEAWVVITIIQYAMWEILEKYPDLHIKIQGIIRERNT